MDSYVSWDKEGNYMENNHDHELNIVGIWEESQPTVTLINNGFYFASEADALAWLNALKQSRA